MNVNLEQIDMLRERANVSYQDAKDALEKCDNDMVEALIYLEKEKKIKTNSNLNSDENTLLDKSVRIIKKGNKTKFVLKKGDNVLVNVPVTAAVLVTICAPYVTFIGVPVALLSGYKMRLHKQDGGEMDVNKVLDKVSDTVIQTKDTLVKSMNEQKNNQPA